VLAASRVIGHRNDIPQRIPGEQKRFRKLTPGRLVAMERKTFESIGEPLPERFALARRASVAGKIRYAFDTCAPRPPQP